MDTQLSKFIDGWLTTSPTISDLCHSALVSCDTISSERIAPPLAPDPASAPLQPSWEPGENALPAGYRVVTAGQVKPSLASNVKLI